MTARGLFPWLAALLVHAGLLLLPLGFLFVPTREQAAPAVELTFAPSRSLAPRAAAGSAGLPRATLDPSVAPRVHGSPAFRTVPSLTGKSSAEDSSGETTSAATGGFDSGAPGGTPANGSTGQDGTGTSFGWAGAPRSVLRGIIPIFPRSLSSSGQEVEGEARITVSSSGAVTRVEITTSTGYIEIDASVEAALRDYLFSRVDSREDALGTVKFRFRLEKTD